MRLFNGLLANLAQRGALDRDFIAAHTRGFEAALAAARAEGADPVSVAKDCGLAADGIRIFFDWFAATPRTVTAFSQGVNQSSHGTDKVNAIVNCHLATARIGAPGMGPFSLTGQPNAMGGREVGGLANQLAAHMDFSDAADRDRVARFWGTQRLASSPGLAAVDLFRTIGEGRVRAVWIMATNPAASLPDAGAVRAALKNCDFVVVSDCVAETDTARFADVLLPAAAWGEKDGTVTNSERRVSRQRAFLRPAGAARADWQIVTDVARRMGFGHAFSYERPPIFSGNMPRSPVSRTTARGCSISRRWPSYPMPNTMPSRPCNGRSRGAHETARRAFSPMGVLRRRMARRVLSPSPPSRPPMPAIAPIRTRSTRAGCAISGTL